MMRAQCIQLQAPAFYAILSLIFLKVGIRDEQQRTEEFFRQF